MITGVDVTRIEANRDKRDLIANMKFNINFDNVKVEKDNVDVAFTFTATYDGTEQAKEVGKLTIAGNITAKESKKDAEEIEKKWKDDKTLPLRFAEDVINMLNFECAARGTLVAYSMGFVAPLPLSRAKLQETEK
ncbi:MAG: hypothetical protein KGH64_03365 [Candidatus Micrarchaeota archaeon]|nr:hypothetical protein [Candidatus Micrarchaeota archaeon]MDE1834351.1 hypothetical protein [Candidatus Micrarchaeota archaeon]MDE1859711.1 hypothetical protein [Candidatus Micrarchaeota archaeon]